MPFAALFSRLILRPLRREPIRTCLTIAAVALGVAAVLAIELAGEAAAGSFRSSLETLSGSANLEVTTSGGIPSEVLSRLAALPYPLKLHPRIEDYALIAGPTRRTVALIGIDLVAEASNRGATPVEIPAAQDFNPGDSVWVSPGLGYRNGDRIRLLINDSMIDYTVRGVLPESSGDAVIMDLAPAAEALRRGARLDRILLETPPDRSVDAWEALLRRELPAGVSIARQGTQTDENRRMMAAFRWNLRVLSYVSLAVGAFLIYNTISVSVVRRRYEIGILRALGTARAGILAAFLSEAAFFGIIGGAAGIALGRVLAEGAVKLVGATVQSLYVSSTPAPLTLTWQLALAGIAIGAGVALISALLPAWEASLVSPVEAMARGGREHQARINRWRDLAGAAALAALAWWTSRQPPVNGKPVFGYICALLLIAGSALTIPVVVSGAAAITSGLVRRVFGVEALLANRSLAGALRRTSVLTGALSTAIAVLTAVGIMVGSFRQTVLVWMNDVLQADLYLSPAVPAGADRHPTLSADIPAEIAALPEVAAVDTMRAYEISYQGLPATIGGIDASTAGRHGARTFLSGTPPLEVFRQLVGADAVIVSEPFANKHRVQRGDTLNLNLGGTTGRFRVLDVYYDYSSERGLILMDGGTLARYVAGNGPSNVAVYLKPGVALAQAKRKVEDALAGRRIVVNENRTLRAQGIRIFDRTFAITYALEAIAVFVAITGVSGALLALIIDRRREFGLLRFLGAAEGQIRRIVLFEAGLLGLLATLSGILLGFVLSLLLIYVINKQSFGWTIQFHWPLAVLLSALALVYAATILAGIYPARVASRLIPIEVIHEE